MAPAWLPALLAGALVGGLWSAWQAHRLEQWRQDHARLSAHWSASGQSAAGQAALAQAWAQRARAWQQRREQLWQLHQAFSAEAAASGLRLQRWQGEARQLALHAVLRSPDDLPAVLSALRAAWPQDWVLDKLSAQPATPGPHPADQGSAPLGSHTVDVVLQAKGWSSPSPPAAGAP